MYMTLRRLAVIVIGAVGIALVWLVSARHELAHDLLIERASDAGVTLSSFDVTSIGFGRATVENIVVLPTPGRAGIEAQRVDAHYDVGSLWNRRITRLDVTGLRMREVVETEDATTPRSGAGDAGPVHGFSSGTSNADLHPVDEIRIHDAEYTIDTAVGSVRLKTEASSSLDLEQTIHFDVEMDLQIDPVTDADAVVSSARLRGTLANDGSLRAGPVDCLEIKASRTFSEIPVQLDAPLALCIRGKEGEALEIADVWRDPRSLRVGLDVERMEISGTFGASDDPTPFDLDVAKVDVEIDATNTDSDPGIRVASNSIKLRLPAQSLAIEDAAFDLEFQLDPSLLGIVGPPVGTVTLGRFLDLEDPPRFPTLSGGGRVRANGDLAEFEFEVGDTEQVIRGHLNGHHDFSSSEGEVKLRVESLDLGSMGEELTSLFPVLMEGLTADAGTVKVVGDAAWRDDGAGTTLGLDIELNDVAVTTESGTLAGLSTRISLGGPDPWRTAEPARITIERIVAGQELTNVVIEFQLREDGTIDFPRVDWQVAGGSASTRGHYDPQSASRGLEIQLVEISLRELLAMIDFEGLDGKGTLAGTIPLHIEGDEIWIRDAQLSSTPEGGKLRYRPNAAASAAASSNQQLKWVTDLFEDFRFSELVIVLNGSVRGDVEAGIHLEGSNPEFQDGVPIEYNLNVDASYADLFAGMALPFEMIEGLSQRVRARNARNSIEEKPGTGEPTPDPGRQSPEAQGSLDAPEAAR